MSKDIRASRPATALNKHPRKALASKEEREKNRKSLKSYFVGGGDDAS